MDQDKIAERLAEVLTGQQELAGEVKALKVEVRVSNERSREEIGVLFNDRDDLQRDVAAIKQDYVPRQTLEKHEDEQREDLKAFSEQIAGLKVSVTRIMAVGAVLFGLIQLAAGWVGK